MREANFSGCTFAGGYLEKAVAYRTNFEGESRGGKLSESSEEAMPFIKNEGHAQWISFPLHSAFCKPLAPRWLPAGRRWLIQLAGVGLSSWQALAYPAAVLQFKQLF